MRMDIFVYMAQDSVLRSRTPETLGGYPRTTQYGAYFDYLHRYIFTGPRRPDSRMGH